MHEYSIIQSLVDSVEAAVGDRQSCLSGQAGLPVVHLYVRRVEVSIGELAGVDTALLETAYEVFRAGTLCEHAPLSVDRIPARWECPRCGGSIARGGRLRCPLCDEAAQLVAGDEIVLKRIELEVA